MNLAALREKPRKRDMAEMGQTFFIAAAIVSLIAHAAAAWRLADVPLGRIDPQLLAAEREVVTVARARSDDLLYQDRLDAAGLGGAATEQASLADLSELLLDAKPTPSPLDAGSASAPVQTREIYDERNDAMADVDAQLVPELTLPELVEQQMLASLSLEAPFIGTQDEGDSGGSGVSADASGPTIQRMLAGANLASGHQPRPGPMERPTLSDRPVVADDWSASPELAIDAIDPTALVLDDTTKLNIPEHLDNDFEYVVTRYDPPTSGWDTFGDTSRGYFRVDITGKRSLKKLQTMPKDVVYLIDTSGSVPQDWVNQVVRGVRDALGALNPGDRFNIVFFSETPSFFSLEGPQPFNEHTLVAAQAFLEEARSGGATDVNRAMSRLLVRDVEVERVYNLILVSDGRPTKGVMDTRELINLITRDNDLAASIYCVGVGTTQNKQLLEFLAYRNKGLCVFADQIGDVATSVRNLASRLRYPIMKDIRMSVAGLDENEVFPRDLPNIHQGETFSIFGRYADPDQFTMRLIGHNGNQLLDLTFARDIREARQGEKQLAIDWAFHKLHFLYSELIRAGEDDREVRQGIDYLRREYKLKTLY